MKKYILRLLASCIGFAGMAAYRVAAAQTNSSSLQDPLQFHTVSDFVAGFLKIIVTLAIPVIGFFIVLIGFQFIAAQGNSSKLSKAKTNAVYVLIGSALVLGAWVLATLLGATVSQLTS